MANSKIKTYNSKRFIAFLIAVCMFVTMVFLTQYTPMEIAGAISIICGVYIGAESYRQSTPNAPG